MCWGEGGGDDNLGCRADGDDDQIEDADDDARMMMMMMFAECI